jgi:hypothetical protein
MENKFRDRFLSISFGIGLLFLSIIAWGDGLVEPANPGEAMGLLSPLLDSFKNKNWAVFAAVLIMLVVYGVRQLGLPFLKDKPDALAIVSQVIGCISAIAVSLYAGQPIWSAIVGGLFIGAAASGLWSAIFKYILPKPKAENAGQ